jgi:hypothetical protein
MSLPNPIQAPTDTEFADFIRDLYKDVGDQEKLDRENAASQATIEDLQECLPDLVDNNKVEIIKKKTKRGVWKVERIDLVYENVLYFNAQCIETAMQMCLLWGIRAKQLNPPVSSIDLQLFADDISVANFNVKLFRRLPGK